MKRRAPVTQILAICLAILIAIPAWPASSTVSPQLPDPGTVSGMGHQEQQQLGLKAAAEVYKQMPVLPDSIPVTQYIQQLGRKLETVIPQEHSWPYQFHVVQQSDINAFALPGGPIFINIGTINAADNEAELAGVMAHEMSHVYMQHSAKQASKESMAQGVLGVLGGMLGTGIGSEIARVGLQIGAGQVFLKYSRTDEAQADAVGAIIMYKAGYNPRAMAEFFEKLEKTVGNGGPQFLSDHPNPGNRTAAIENEIRNWPPENYLATSADFTRAKQQAASIKSYNAQQIADGAKQGLWAQQNAKAGAVLSGTPAPTGAAPTAAPAAPAAAANLASVSYSQVKPNGNFNTLNLNVLSIAYPSNWQTANGQTSLTIAPGAGASQGAIAYGVMISGLRGSGSIDNTTATLVQNLQQSNPGMSIFDSQKSIQVAGKDARTVMLQGNSPVQQSGKPVKERDWLVTVPRADGTLLALVFIAPDRDFNQLKGTYQRMLDSLQVK
jgi:Zn-dependent protease with chaperone function